MDRLRGKVVIITGGASGIGAATARLFVAEGATVVIADILAEQAGALVGELGPQSSYQLLNVEAENDWCAVVDDTVQRFGCIDVLVNNAGVNRFEAIVDMSKTNFEKVIGINLVGTFLGLKVVGRVMLRQKRGSIINISSVDGMKGANSLAAYCSSKWGVRGLTKVAAMEFGHQGVRVNSIHPGGVDTAMGNLRGVSKEAINKYFFGQPMQRIGEPEEIARTSLFLASDDASYLCGAEIVVDGGQLVGHYYAGLPGAPQAL